MRPLTIILSILGLSLVLAVQPAEGAAGAAKAVSKALGKGRAKPPAAPHARAGQGASRTGQPTRYHTGPGVGMRHGAPQAQAGARRPAPNVPPGARNMQPPQQRVDQGVGAGGMNRHAAGGAARSPSLVQPTPPSAQRAPAQPRRPAPTPPPGLRNMQPPQPRVDQGAGAAGVVRQAAGGRATPIPGMQAAQRPSVANTPAASSYQPNALQPATAQGKKQPQPGPDTRENEQNDQR